MSGPRLNCWCPTAEHDEGSILFVHNSADLREEYEKVTGDALPGNSGFSSSSSPSD
jgi:hypothetical protein